MGKISEYIIELGETFQDLLDQHGNYDSAIDDMRDLLSKDEFEFFNAHLDIIEQNLDFTDGYEGMSEASGLKGDVLRPYGGRKARSKMGYGRGNRAGFNPEEEIDTPEQIERDDIIMQDIEDDDGAPLTSTIIDGEEVFDVGQSEDDFIYGEEDHDLRMQKRKEMLAKPYPVGSGGVDNVFDDEGRRIEESYIMPPLNEDWTFIQEAGLIIAAGAILIGIVNGKKGSPESLSWKAWMENKLDFIPAMRKRRVSREIKQGVSDYSEESIDIDALEEILNQDPSLQKTIESLKRGNKYGYAQLYNKLKSHLGAYTIEGTPIKKIKGEFNKQGVAYKEELEAKKQSAKDTLETFANGENDIQAVLTALSAFDEPEWGPLWNAFNRLIENPNKYQDFYRAIKSFYMESYITDTPGKKIVARLKREAKEGARNNIKAGDPEAFNAKHTMESLEMPSLTEYFDDDGEDQWVTINGKRVHKDSREYQKWYEEEGEFDDTEGRDWRRKRYGR